MVRHNRVWELMRQPRPYWWSNHINEYRVDLWASCAPVYFRGNLGTQARFLQHINNYYANQRPSA